MQTDPARLDLDSFARAIAVAKATVRTGSVSNDDMPALVLGMLAAERLIAAREVLLAKALIYVDAYAGSLTESYQRMGLPPILEARDNARALAAEIDVALTPPP